MSGSEIAAVTGVELARLSGVTPDNIYYWVKKGYLEKQSDSPHARVLLSQLPKAKVMAILTVRLQIKTEKASSIADEFLARYRGQEDAFCAMVAAVESLNSAITNLVDMILNLNLLPILESNLKKEAKRKSA